MSSSASPNCWFPSRVRSGEREAAAREDSFTSSKTGPTNVCCIHKVPFTPNIGAGGKVAICVKGMDFKTDMSGWLLEWLLLAREQEYGKVYLYFYKTLGPASRKVVKYTTKYDAPIQENVSTSATSAKWVSLT